MSSHMADMSALRKLKMTTNPLMKKMKQLVSQLEGQFAESGRLETLIKRNFKELGYGE